MAPPRSLCARCLTLKFGILDDFSVHESTAALEKNQFTVLYCDRTSLAGTSRRVQRVQAGLGLGLGGQGQGQADLGLGVQGVLGKVIAGIPEHSLEGFLTNHRSHCSKTLISATAPQLPPLK